MKKNKMMRLASAMMVTTLMTTSVISGTFAKYVTSDDANDVARVAKFGVTVTAAGSLFADTYKLGTNTPGEDGEDVATLSVDSDNGDNVVAPGTKNVEGLTFTVNGKPEVDVAVALEVTNKDGSVTENEDLEEIFLAKKSGLPDMTTGNDEDVFENTADYYPIVYIVTCTGTAADTQTFTTLKAMADWLETTFTKEYDANTDLSTVIGAINITWNWDFDNSGAGTYDKQDTLLGDIAAGTTLVPTTTLNVGTDYNLTTDLGIKVTVTQID